MDDGWLLTVAYDSCEHRSRLLVLDARDPERDALYAGRLKHHAPQSFHGPSPAASPGRSAEQAPGDACR